MSENENAAQQVFGLYVALTAEERKEFEAMVYGHRMANGALRVVQTKGRGRPAGSPNKPKSEAAPTPLVL